MAPSVIKVTLSGHITHRCGLLTTEGKWQTHGLIDWLCIHGLTVSSSCLWKHRDEDLPNELPQLYWTTETSFMMNAVFSQCIICLCNQAVVSIKLLLKWRKIQRLIISQYNIDCDTWITVFIVELQNKMKELSEMPPLAKGLFHCQREVSYLQQRC